MKKIALFVGIALLAAACNNAQTETETISETTADATETSTKYAYFGDSTFDVSNAVPSTELLAFMEGKDSVKATVSGKIASVCKKKGCWMGVAVDDGSEMHVTYNYEFLLPLNSDGKNMIMDGYAYFDTIPVSHLKHLAEDAGKSPEEIEKITTPKATLAFLATGVMIEE